MRLNPRGNMSRPICNAEEAQASKPVRLDFGLTGTPNTPRRSGVNEIPRRDQNSRKGWTQDSARLNAAGDDALRWPEFGNDEDARWSW